MNTESELWKRETKSRNFEMIEQPAIIMTVTSQNYGFTPCSSKGTLWGSQAAHKWLIDWTSVVLMLMATLTD